jgi:hypothetical protein
MQLFIDGDPVDTRDTRAPWRGLETYGDDNRPVRTSYTIRWHGRWRVVWLAPWGRPGCYYVNVHGRRVAVDYTPARGGE